MSLTNDQITAKNFKAFYDRIYPYLNGAAHTGYTPIGTIIAVMGNTAPQNYLSCEGQVVNIADYPELAAYFEIQFGSKNNFGGNGTTTFGIPDLRGEFLRGTGTNGHTNQGSGANIGEHQDSTVLSFMVVKPSASSGYIRIQGDSNAENVTPLNADSNFPSGTTIKYANVSASQVNTSSIGDRSTIRPTNTSVLYCIAYKDVYIDTRHDYSLTERVIGTWIDGKPLYQKTVDCGELPNKTTKNIVHGISNFDVPVNIFGYGYSSTSKIPLPHVDCVTLSNSVTLNCDDTNITIKTNLDRTNYTNSYVTVQYTKTTD